LAKTGEGWRGDAAAAPGLRPAAAVAVAALLPAASLLKNSPVADEPLVVDEDGVAPESQA
jgi:hypothetical protein